MPFFKKAKPKLLKTHFYKTCNTKLAQNLIKLEKPKAHSSIITDKTCVIADANKALIGLTKSGLFFIFQKLN